MAEHDDFSLDLIRQRVPVPRRRRQVAVDILLNGRGPRRVAQSKPCSDTRGSDEFMATSARRSGSTQDTTCSNKPPPNRTAERNGCVAERADLVTENATRACLVEEPLGAEAADEAGRIASRHQLERG